MKYSTILLLLGTTKGEEIQRVKTPLEIAEDALFDYNMIIFTD